jgi:pyruvate carboxylase subunit B
MNDVLKEIPRVRKDLGYPPLVTPTSQIVGTQAVLNVMTGERYKSVTNEVKNYFLGQYGKSISPMSADVQKIAIGDAEVMDCRPADMLKPEMEKLASDVDRIAKNEEDVLTYAMFPDIGKTFLQERNANSLVPEVLLTKENAQATGPRYAPDEFNVTLHGETFHIKLTGAGHEGDEVRPIYVSVDGIAEEVMVETLSEIELAGSGQSNGANVKKKASSSNNGRPRPSHKGCITTAMPGCIVEVKVVVGDKVNAGDAVLVIEAMKMENEIEASTSGTVVAIIVQKGDSVTPDESLLEIQPN